MTVSRAKRSAVRRGGLRQAVAGISTFIFALVAAGTVVPGGADAQLQLRRPTPVVTPSAETPPAAEPAETAPESAPTAPAPAGVTVAPRPLDDAGITVNRLESVDPDAIGLLTDGQGGFAQNMWQGAEWALVRGLMPRIPAGSPSPTLRDIATRLLISQASVPVGKPLEASFVALRVDRLLAAGDVANALALLRITPDERRDEALSRTRVEALFFNNNNSGACKAIRNGADEYSGLYWSQAQAFCLALSGEHARASLIADLLRERESEIEPLFFAAIDALAGSKGGESPTLRTPLALHLSMMRAASFRFPAEIVETGQASILRAVALAPNADLDIRLIAAEKAQRIGALSGDEIVGLALGIPFSKQELNGPISAAEESWTPRTRALLLRAAASQQVALAKAEVLRRAWELGRERDGYAQIAGASVSIVEAIDPAAELIWFARDAAQVLFAAGRSEKALGWYVVAADDAGRIEEARVAEAALWPLAVLADRQETVPFTPERLRAWFDARRQADPQKTRREALAFFTLLDAIGKTIPPDMWQMLLDSPFSTDDPALSPAWSHRLSGASAGARVGEAVLLTVVGAGESTNGQLTLADAARAISALRQLGLTPESHRLAVEAAVAAGL
tara:strand:- start:540 stop:2411 length:1872 start_codon:yes stop_codon:yes gene_type:complete